MGCEYRACWQPRVLGAKKPVLKQHRSERYKYFGDWVEQ